MLTVSATGSAKQYTKISFFQHLLTYMAKALLLTAAADKMQTNSWQPNRLKQIDRQMDRQTASQQHKLSTWHVSHVRSLREPGTRHGPNGTPPGHVGAQGGSSRALLLHHGLLP